MTTLSEKEATCLIQLKKMIKDSEEDQNLKNLVNLLGDDDWLLAFIRTKKFDVQAAFDAGKKLISVIKKYPETIERIHPESLRPIVSLEGKGPLKERDGMGCQVLVIRLKCWDPKLYSIEDFLLSLILIGKEFLKNKESQINGINIIANIEGITFTQARQFTPFVIKRFVDIIVNSTPLKFKGLHITNVHPFVNVPLSLLKCLLPEKLKKRVHSHSHNDSLHKLVNPSILPDWLGGSLPESEVFDKDLLANLYSPQRLEWYTKVTQLAKNQLKK